MQRVVEVQHLTMLLAGSASGSGGGSGSGSMSISGTGTLSAMGGPIDLS